ncbi:Small ubiquitin-related modifier [Gryllus bimaculatus]|nr:Small ubiquitin-related modifier [Gryllus bimaculatus]
MPCGCVGGPRRKRRRRLVDWRRLLGSAPCGMAGGASTSGFCPPGGGKGNMSLQSEEWTSLRVIDTAGNSMVFRIKPSCPLQKVKKRYSDKCGVDIHTLRFLYEGRRVDDQDTAISLKIERNGIIEVFAEQTGGSFIKNETLLKEIAANEIPNLKN